jgi:hypothetical protein
MKGLQNIVISSRFILTMGHLIAILLTFWTYRSNVWIGLKDDAGETEVTDAERSVLVRVPYLQDMMVRH